MVKFNELKTRDDLADFLDIPHRVLTHLLYKKRIENCYLTFEISKKSGGTRKIAAPCPELKAIQQKLAWSLQDYQSELWKERNISPNISHAFEPKKSIITNAFIHRNKRYVLNLDLENFFGTIHFGRVCGFFQKHRDFKLPYEVSVVIAQLACYNGVLPQGAPSSPIIANMICQSLDMHLLSVAKGYKLDYTRYADDLTFSTNNKHFLENRDRFFSAIQREIKRAGFTINEKKTRLLFRDSRQEVTGLVVNKKLNVNKQYIKDTRAMAHQLYTTGDFVINDEKGTLAQLEGRFSFIDQLDHYNNQIDSDKGNTHDAFHLNARERQYKAFLFYKYFFANEKPLIITEGKTDIRYIKAALKKEYTSYPELIEKREDGSFNFKISFFNRSKRWRYFFNLSMDGADAMKVLYRHFSGVNKQFNYMKYFQSLSGQNPRKPVIFLYDNETENKNKHPLQSFLSEAKISENDRTLLQQQLYLRLIEGGNLYLVTNPLKAGEKESEIEDLFTQETLAHKIQGREFTKAEKYDTSKKYGKEIFSQYIMRNYEKIDFSGFRPLLNAIDKTQKAMEANG